MDPARLLYGELEIDAKDGLFQVAALDEGFDLLTESAYASQEGLDAFSETSNETAKSVDGLGFSFESLGESLSFIGMFLIFGTILYDLISSTQSFQKVIQALQKAFEPLVKIIGEFAEYVGTYIADVLLFVIDLLSQFITYLTQTEQGIALLKTAAIFFAVTAGVLLVASFKAIAASAYSALTAFTAMITPMLPFIAIAAAVAAAITTIILVLEDLYYFATGEGESVAAEFFEMIGLSKEEIESIRKQIKEFIDTVKALWENFMKSTTKLVPAFKKIFNNLLAIVKSFFVSVFKLGYNLIGVFAGVWDIVKGLFTGNFDLILQGFNKIKDSVLGIFRTLIDYVKGLFDNLMEMIAPLKEIVSGLFNSGQQPIKPIAGARAEGGPVKAGESYLVGEKGAEIFAPSSNGVIIPNSQLSSMPSMMGGGKSTLQSIIGQVNITVSGGENMKQDMTNQIKEIIRQASIEAGQELGLVI